MSRGFTLLELLFVIAFLAAIAWFSIPTGVSTYQRSIAASDANTVASALRSARSESLHHLCGSPACADQLVHGIRVSAEHIVAFEGVAFEDRDPEYDVEFPLYSYRGNSADILFSSEGIPDAGKELIFGSGAGQWRVDLDPAGEVSVRSPSL